MVFFFLISQNEICIIQNYLGFYGSERVNLNQTRLGVMESYFLKSDSDLFSFRLDPKRSNRPGHENFNYNKYRNKNYGTLATSF